MNRLILFSPIGGTDPISLNNEHDGAFLHICRVYRPTDVVMYLSAEMLKFHRKDNRYLYCLEKLCGHLSCRIEPHVIERPDLVNVYEFDWFYHEFRNIFHEIFTRMDETDRLLVNISSGTPAMKSGLCVLTAMGEYPATVIQVTTPVGGLNEHTHMKAYEDDLLEVLWESDCDNEDGFKNRCIEIKSPNLLLLRNEEILKKLILNYDYHAAVLTAEELPSSSRSPYFTLLELAEARKQLDFPTTDILSKAAGVDFIPVKASDQRKYMEYALTLDLKQRCGEYTDFLRALTPLVVDLYELVLKKQFGIVVDSYCHTSSDGVRKWSLNKLQGTPILNILDREYSDKGGFRVGPISSDHLKAILDAQDFTRDEGLSTIKDILGDLRYVEENVRNPAAHEIVCIKDSDIMKRTGFNSRQIMKKVKSVFPYAGINVKSGDWDSYDRMNEEIIRRIVDFGT